MLNTFHVFLRINWIQSPFNTSICRGRTTHCNRASLLPLKKAPLELQREKFKVLDSDFVQSLLSFTTIGILFACVSIQIVTRPQSSWFLRGPSVQAHVLPHRRGYSIDLSASQGGRKLCCHGNSGVECRSLNSIKMMLSRPKSRASVLMGAEKVGRDVNRCLNDWGY